MFNIALNWYIYKHLKVISLVFLLSVTHIASILKVGDKTCSKHFDKQIKKKRKKKKQKGIFQNLQNPNPGWGWLGRYFLLLISFFSF